MVNFEDGAQQPVTAETITLQADELAGGTTIEHEEAGQPANALEGALTAVALGFAVFPCNPLNKRPLINDWRNNATRDQQAIMDWWTANPDIMVGAVTGSPSGYFVIDIDVKDGIDAETKLKALRDQFGDLGAVFMVSTPSGGLHLYCKMPPDEDVRNSTSVIAHGVDIRGTGGYVIFPGSYRHDGKKYRFVKEV